MNLSKIGNYVIIYLSHFFKVFSFVLLLPLFTRTFDKDIWGLVVAAQAFSFWLQIIVEYGYNLSATRSISQMGEDKQKIVGYIISVFKSKAILAVSAVIISGIAFIFFDSVSRFGSLIVWVVLFAIVQGFAPVWYYLSLNKLHLYSAYDLVSRISYLTLCIVFIKSDSDAFMVFAFGVVTGMIPIVMSLINFKKFKANTKYDKMKIIFVMRDSFPIFLFAIVTSVYTSLNILILSNYAALSVVAVYSVADRIVRTSGSLLEPLNRIFYAKMSRDYVAGLEISRSSLKKVSLVLSMAGILIFLALQVLGSFLISILAPKYGSSVEYISILSFYIPFLILNNILGLHIVLPLGLDKQFNIIFMVSSLCSLIAMMVVVPKYGALGLAYITIITEIAVSISFVGLIAACGGVKSMIERFNYENKLFNS